MASHRLNVLHWHPSHRTCEPQLWSLSRAKGESHTKWQTLDVHTHTLTLPPSPSPEAPTQALIISPLSLGSSPNGFPWNLAFPSVLGKAHCVSYFSTAVVSTMTEATYKFNLGLLVSGARTHGHHSGEHDSRTSTMGLEK